MKKMCLLVLVLLVGFSMVFVSCDSSGDDGRDIAGEDTGDDSGDDTGDDGGEVTLPVLTEAQVTEAMEAFIEVMDDCIDQVNEVVDDILGGGTAPEGFVYDEESENIELTAFGVDIDEDGTSNYILTGSFTFTKAEAGANTVSTSTIDIEAAGEITVDGTIISTYTETTADLDFVSNTDSIVVSISGVTGTDSALALVSWITTDVDGNPAVVSATIDGEDYTEMIQGIIDSSLE